MGAFSGCCNRFEAWANQLLRDFTTAWSSGQAFWQTAKNNPVNRTRKFGGLLVVKKFALPILSGQCYNPSPRRQWRLYYIERYLSKL
jgi:hypothetical protein